MEDDQAIPMMECTIAAQDVEVSLSVSGHYSPDVLDDLQHRTVVALVTTVQSLKANAA